MDENTKIRCPKCGGRTTWAFNPITIDDKYIGKYEVTGIRYKKCVKCGEEVYGHEALEEIEKVWANLLRGILGTRPLRDFMTELDTLIELNISKKKLNTIKYNTLYRYLIANIFLYLRESVEQFNKTGDGRVILI